jgi:hypothetical protein
MCVIIISENANRPSMDVLQKCANANPHGIGVAWKSADWIHFRKTNDLDEVYALNQKADGPVVTHFRWASVGGVSDDLRHPFPAVRATDLREAGKTKAALFQNGTFSEWESLLDKIEVDTGFSRPTGAMSDARAVAWAVGIYGPDILKRFTGSRWVYLTPKRLVMYGHWQAYAGMKFSNLHWMPRPPRKAAQEEFAFRRTYGGASEYWDIIEGRNASI